jgi:hypothetical protein
MTKILNYCILTTNLVSEGAGHDKAGMASCTPKIHEPSLGQYNYTGLGFRKDKPVRLRLDCDPLDTWVCLQPKHINLIIKVTYVANDGIVLHFLHVVNHYNILVTC